MQSNPCGKSAIISAAVSGTGKVIMWHQNVGWGGQAAADMYNGPLAKALKKAYPSAKRARICEDNDPAGFKSGKALAAKSAQDFLTFDLPPRSPDLQVLDYFVWSEVQRRMRAQEEKFPATLKETREAFLSRLRKTAQGLPPSLVLKAIRDMKRRAQLLFAAQGGLFEE
jgi:hypothetical protein